MRIIRTSFAFGIVAGMGIAAWVANTMARQIEGKP
jgi:hypothetical protein